ncbi:MAG TPA: site-specific DNA-methyltransferase [Abditibacterium sp.]|jgi:site-specific DNA-methyltransferase (adenine-specific)
MQLNTIHTANCLDWMAQIANGSVHLVVADPPYFRVQLQHEWDNQWPDEAAYLDWSMQWLREAMRALVPGGLLYVFGQVGKREHVWMHLQSRACAEFGFHDLIIWDRAVGYNERRDSFTPAYEMILVFCKAGASPRFDKDAVREAYDQKTQAIYLKDARYKNLEARREHLKRGKYATNVWRIPSLKGSSKEKLGHPTQKPLALIERLIASSSREGDVVFDPFCGSGTTLFAAKKHKRDYLGIEINAEYADLARRRLENL